jgi:putative hemolysin
MTGPLLEIVVIAVLVLFNAVFSATELALVTTRRGRLEQLESEGDRRAGRVRRLKEHPARFLAVVQIGITFVGFLAAAFAGVRLSAGLEASLAGVPVIGPYAGTTALVVVTGILTIFTIIFGELVPKAIALGHAERVAVVFAPLIDVIGRLFAPLVAFLTWTTNRIARLLGVDVTLEQRVSADELRILIEQSGEQGLLEAEEEQMITAVIELGSQRVHEVMVPRVSIAALPSTGTFEEATELIISAGHSRIPVYEETIDHIVGILYAKDLLPFLRSAGDPRPSLRELVRPPLLVPESLPVDDVLHQLQRRRIHMAIVLDEYGGTAGLVTIEDLLEEIVGEIQDEYDVEEPLVVRISDDEVRVDGRAAVDELAELFGVELSLADEDEYDTVGGLVFHRIGGVPSPGDRIEVDGLTLTVETTHGRRVGRVLVVRRAPASEPDEAEP